MGLGSEIGEWDDYEFFDLADVPEPGPEPFLDAMVEWLSDDLVWQPGDGARVLLVDLDNIRVEPERLRARVALTVALARQASYAAFAGQQGSVRRARPHLAEFATKAVTVPAGADLADHALLAVADDVPDADVQFVVMSNDNIFRRLAVRGPLTVLSPGADALSDRLEDAAVRVIDLADLERRVSEALPAAAR